MNFLNKKRKLEELKKGQIPPNLPASSQEASQELKIEDLMAPLKGRKLNGMQIEANKDDHQNNQIKIRIKDQVSIEKGYFNLPKEIIEEAIAHNYKVLFKPKKDSGLKIYYYECSDSSFKMRIKEYPDKIKALITTTTLISNFKTLNSFTISGWNM